MSSIAVERDTKGLYSSVKTKDEEVKYIYPYMFYLEDSFNNYTDYLRYIEKTVGTWQGLDKLNNDIFQADGTSSSFDQALSIDNYVKGSQSSTEVGMNNAINCLWQFGWDDDIVHPVNAIGNVVDPGVGGLGRVYAENYDSTQQLLYISVGIPKFNTAGSWLNSSIQESAMRMNSGGDNFSILKELGRLVGFSIKLAITYYTLPFTLISWLGDFAENLNVTKYVDFEPSMVLYYKFVNTAMVNLAVNMGLLPNGVPEDPNKQSLFETFTEWMGASSIGSQTDRLYMSLWSPTPDKDDANSLVSGLTIEERKARIEQGLPKVMQGDFDIFSILAKRDNIIGIFREAGKNGDKFPTADAIAAGNYPEYTPKKGWFTHLKARANSSTMWADKFVSFRIDKNVDSSESFSSSTRQTAAAQYVNSITSAARDKREGHLASLLGTESLTNKFLSGIVDAVKSAASTLGGEGLASIMLGDGFVDFPEIWDNSSFSKSHSFSFELRSPYGDPVSIFQSIYIPLLMLLCMSLPRAVGPNAYTSPFYVRMYAKGMIAVPFGLIESISITRGSAEFGWNKSFLPTVVKVNITVKDLAPAMYMAVQNGSDATGIFTNLKNIVAAPTAFGEYLMTLAGLGWVDRVCFSRRIARQSRIFYHLTRTTICSPFFWGTTASETTVGKIVAAFQPVAGRGSGV